MADVAAYMSVGAVLPDGGLNPFDYGSRLTAENGPTSVLKTPKGNAHKSCPDSRYFQEKCAHGNWRWCGGPCGKWSCEPCRDDRVKTELVPEISRAMSQAWAIGKTLKHVTLTGDADDIVTKASPEGAEAMRVKLQHFVQAQRRKGRTFEYLRVGETHKSGRVHLHLLVLMPYVSQREMEDMWGARVWVSAVGLRCPECFPGRSATPKEKRRSTIVPPPGKGSCPNCGYKVDWAIGSGNVQAVAEIAALEMSKYLTKEASIGGIKKKMNRSRGWAKLFQMKPDKMPAYCDECGDEHAFGFVGPSDRLNADYPGLPAAAGAQVAYYPRSGGPCQCWVRGDGESRWVASLSPRASSGLIDLVLPEIDYGLQPHAHRK